MADRQPERRDEAGPKHLAKTQEASAAMSSKRWLFRAWVAFAVLWVAVLCAQLYREVRLRADITRSQVIREAIIKNANLMKELKEPQADIDALLKTLPPLREAPAPLHSVTYVGAAVLVPAIVFVFGWLWLRFGFNRKNAE
jgi:hypothetical protein